MPGRVLVTGGSGQVGGAVAKLAAANGFTVHAPGRDELDLTSGEAIAAIVDDDWTAIINCAAYTAVDRAESEPDLAYAVNADAPEAFGRAAAKRGIPLLHVSTDYVFDGSKDGFYSEDDSVAPLGIYGLSKEAGERAVRDAAGPHVILRTAWVVSATGANFVKTMLRVGAERDLVRVVDDQHGCPTTADDIAQTLLTLAARPIEGGETLHFVNDGDATWHDLAGFVFCRAKAAGRKVPVLEAIPTSAYPTPAKRPANSRLSTSRIRDRHGVTPRPWQDAIGDVLDRLMHPAA